MTDNYLLRISVPQLNGKVVHPSGTDLYLPAQHLIQLLLEQQLLQLLVCYTFICWPLQKILQFER